MRRPIIPLAAGALLALLAPATARAGEHPWHLGGSLGYSSLFGGPSAQGFGGGVHAAYGLNDMFNLMGTVDVTAHPTGPWLIWSGAVGATYVVDVLEWVPYVGALAGGAALIAMDPKCGASIAEPCRAFRLDLEVPFGLDYQVSRRFSVGLAGRLRVLLLGDNPWMTLGVFARAEATWGY